MFSTGQRLFTYVWSEEKVPCPWTALLRVCLTSRAPDMELASGGSATFATGWLFCLQKGLTRLRVKTASNKESDSVLE